MSKLLARYRALEQQKKFVDITQVRGMVKYMDNVREQHGSGLAKTVRLLAAQMVNGFEVVSLERGTVFDQLKILGVNLQIEGRNAKIPDLEGEFSYTDDYHYTATKYALYKILRKFDIKLTLVDQRDRNSVQKIFGDKSDSMLVAKFRSGEYLNNKFSKFWGGKGLDVVRSVRFKDVALVGK